MDENSDTDARLPRDVDSPDVHNAGDLDEWAAELAAALGLTGVMNVDVHQILALAGDAAHAIVRPAAPLTTFIVGFAAGRGSLDGSVDAASATEIARSLAHNRSAANSKATD